MLVQALIENVVREDLGPMDTARGLKALQDVTGWSAREMGRRGLMSHEHASRLLLLLNEPEEIQGKLAGLHGNGCGTVPHLVTERHVSMARQSGLSDNDKVDVIRKVEREGLTAKQTRYVAVVVIV